MSRVKSLLFLFVLGVQVPLASATITYEVGTCKKGFTSFATISAAVAATPAPDVVEVCPGVYFEQVVIATPLTLEGIPGASSTVNTAIIAPPSSGYGVNVTSILGVSVGPSVLVETGPVNITNIVVEGGSCNGCTDLAGIFYESGSYGTVSKVAALGGAAGIWAENGNPGMDTMTIENSDIDDVSFAGILLASNQTPPTLTAAVKGNTVVGSSVGPAGGILNYGATGSIADNVLSDFTEIGIFDYQGSGLAISGNKMTNAEANGPVEGIYLWGSDEVVRNNSISNGLISGDAGIYLGNSGGATVEDNTIANSDVAIEFNCNTGTVSANTINLAATGIDQVPSTLAVTNVNNWVFTFRSNCNPASSGAKTKLPLILKKLMQ